MLEAVWRMYLNDLGLALEQAKEFVHKEKTDKPSLLIDIGSGNGGLTSVLAKYFSVSEALMVDKNVQSRHYLAEQMKFMETDITSPDFRMPQKENTVRIVTSFQCLHEGNPTDMASAIFNVNEGDLVILWDHAESGWKLRGSFIDEMNFQEQAHFREDMANVRKSGFDKDAVIGTFWTHQQQTLPGHLSYIKLTYTYLVLYRA